jgi:hypothetical protein
VLLAFVKTLCRSSHDKIPFRNLRIPNSVCPLSYNTRSLWVQCGSPTIAQYLTAELSQACGYIFDQHRARRVAHAPAPIVHTNLRPLPLGSQVGNSLNGPSEALMTARLSPSLAPLPTPPNQVRPIAAAPAAGPLPVAVAFAPERGPTMQHPAPLQVPAHMLPRPAAARGPHPAALAAADRGVGAWVQETSFGEEENPATGVAASARSQQAPPPQAQEAQQTRPRASPRPRILTASESLLMAHHARINTILATVQVATPRRCAGTGLPRADVFFVCCSRRGRCACSASS